MIQIDMPMPTNCLDCPACNEYLMCAIPANGRGCGENDVREYGQSRPEWCPMKEQEEETSRLTKMCKVLLNKCKAIANADGATCAYCTLKEECDKIYMD